jgi:integrase
VAAHRPVKTGKQFRGPSKKTLRQQRAQNGKRTFEADEIRKILDAAGPQLKAMVLLGINCGFGNTDVATLPVSALDLDRSWVDFPRPKTGIPRRCPLWPETVAALNVAITRRTAPKNPEHAERVFITNHGNAWVEVACTPQEDGTLKVCADDAVSKAVRKLLRRLDINGKRNFYALRRGTETVGSNTSRDQIAVDAIMGHVDPGGAMAATYRERIDDNRLLAVTNHIHNWLFGSQPAE